MPAVIKIKVITPTQKQTYTADRLLYPDH